MFRITGSFRESAVLALAVAWVASAHSQAFANAPADDNAEAEIAETVPPRDVSSSSLPANMQQLSAAEAEESVSADTPADTTFVDDNTILVSGTRVSQSDLSEVPGGTSVVDIEELQGSRIGTLSDVLEFVPGVFAQSISGGEGTLLSVRGSGLTKGGFSYGNGTQVLIDGLPITSMYGTPYESFEPNAVSRVDIYKGANAFEWGATQLGGVINFIQRTGKDADRLTARAEFGSYGYNRQQLATGQILGDFDYYISATRFHTDGYLDNSEASSQRLYANAGWQATSHLSTRLYFSLSRLRAQNISNQTRAQVYGDPRGSNLYTGYRLNKHSVILGSKTVYDFDGKSSLELALGYKAMPLYNGNLPQQTFWNLKDWSGTLRYRYNGSIAGHENNLTAAVITNHVVGGSSATVFNVDTDAVLGKVRYGGHNTTLLISNDFAITPELWLLGGIAWIDQERYNEILNPVAAGVPTETKRSYSNWTPRIGLRYDITPTLSTFANFSRLIEAPQVISYTTSAAGAYTGFTPNGLKVQNGDSYEVGIKGSLLNNRLHIDLSYYNEQLKNELLTVYTVLPGVDPANPNGITATTNAAPTVKAGIEASVNAVLWRDGDSNVALKQAYTWNDFHFKERNLALGQGVAPRVPIHFYQADLTFNHASGFYVGGQVEAVLGRYPVDYVNQTYAPAYTLWGLTAGYSAPSGKWRVFLQAQNIGDKKYVSSAVQTFRATASSAIYTPGVGRNITGGVAFNF